MDTLLLFCVRLLLRIVWALPLTWVARIGRGAGSLGYLLDARHRRIAQRNIDLCFGKEMTPRARHDLVREHFRRLGENYACALRTIVMPDQEIDKVLTVEGSDKILAHFGTRTGAAVIAIGHFGNFELYARRCRSLPGFQFATTYRALRQPTLNRLFQELRSRSGCLYFERRSEAQAIKEALTSKPLMLGLLSDQHASGRGLPLPFFGHTCSTTPAPALYALRYQLPLFTAICYRIKPGQWRIEIGDAIPTEVDGTPRSVMEISRDINLALEAGVRRDPANWFWVHNRWKPDNITRSRLSSTPPASDYIRSNGA